MIHTLIYILVVGVIIGLIWWICDYLPIPEPLNKLIKIVSIVIGVIVIIFALLSIAGIETGIPLR